MPKININWITLWLCFFFGLLFTILFRFLNKRSKPVDQRRDAALPLDGWVLFLGINLIVRILIQCYFFWKADYFLNSAWLKLGQAGGAGFHSLFIFEMFLSFFALVGSGALIYWFFQRRDIFPSMFVYYVCFYLIANLVLMFIYQNITLPAEMISIRHNMVIQIFRILYAGCWVIFVLKSENVKLTFVYPHG